MFKFIKECLELLSFSSRLDEMTVLKIEDTGLDYPIRLGKVGGQHGPRIKVSNIKGVYKGTSHSFVMSIDKNPLHKDGKVLIPTKSLKDIQDWVN